MKPAPELVERIVRKVLAEMMGTSTPTPGTPPAEAIEDITKRTVAELSGLEASDPAFIARLVASTPARLCIGRRGTRYPTKEYLRFRADYSLAKDAVHSEIDEAFCTQNGLHYLRSRCSGKEEYLTRPDLGRLLDEESERALQQCCPPGVRVLILVSDGLAPSAVEAHVPDTLAGLRQGLERRGITSCSSIFVRYGRVGLEDQIGILLKAESVIILIGERPGLGNSSVGAYMVYKPEPTTTDAQRNCFSNICPYGTPPAEAGAHLAGVMEQILTHQASGLALTERMRGR